MTRDCRRPPKLRHYVLCQCNPIGGSLVGGEEWLVRADSSVSAGRHFGPNDKQRARAETRVVLADLSRAGGMNVKLCSHSLMIASFLLLPLPAAAQVHAQAKQYPSKPVTIISDSAAGSTPDAVLRVIGDRLSQMWGQQVLAVNHPGATGSIASRIAADSPPDGYTLYMPVLSS